MATGPLSCIRRHLAIFVAATAATLSGCGFLPGVGYRNPAHLRGTAVIPRKLPRSPYGNTPYTVDGRTYYPLRSARGYKAFGIASWYGKPFNGQKTSDGSTYNMYAMTAANKVLPLPSYALVRNLSNGRSAIVLVNDRGPFYPHRIIDLSYAAAAKLGVLATGTARVEVEGIVPGESPVFGQEQRVRHRHHEVFPPPRSIAVAASTRRTAQPQPRPLPTRPQPVALADPPAPQPQSARPHGPFVQFGAYSTHGMASREAQRLREAGLVHIHVMTRRIHGERLYLVRQGPAQDLAAAQQMAAYAGHVGLGRTYIVGH